MRRRVRRPTLAALIFAIGLALVGSTSHALYLASMGPKDCCREHCHRGEPVDAADAERCCATHLGVLPSGLAGPTADVQHVFAAVGTALPAAVLAVPTRAPVAPAPSVQRRGSLPGTLVGFHTALLI